jgi:hypothetical protein
MQTAARHSEVQDFHVAISSGVEKLLKQARIIGRIVYFVPVREGVPEAADADDPGLLLLAEAAEGALLVAAHVADMPLQRGQSSVGQIGRCGRPHVKAVAEVIREQDRRGEVKDVGSPAGCPPHRHE